MTSTRLVIVGAGLAGLRAAQTARADGFDGQIVLIGAEPHLPYDRPPLSKAYLEDPAPTAPHLTSNGQLADLDITGVFGSVAIGLDDDNKTIQLDDREITYDALVIATGATARALPTPPAMAGVHSLRTLDDAIAVRAGLDAGARTVVVGAGFIGSEVASNARKRGSSCVIVEADATPLTRAVGPEMGSLLAQLHAREGTELRCGVRVTSLVGGSTVEGVELSDGTSIEADMVVAGIGADPAVEWLTGSNVQVDNGVVCDQTLWTGVDGVYAAGDVARWENPLFGRSMRIEHWSSAAEQAARATRNALDPSAAQEYSTVPYFWSDWYGSRIQFVGHPLAEEVRVVDGDAPTGDQLVALYRDGDRVVGALTVNRPAEIMKYRGLINRRATWHEALEFCDSRRRARALAH